MVTPITRLNNPYYFIKNNIVFKISYSMDNDKDCAQHKVTYVTEAKQLKKGDTYRDLHDDAKKAESNGTYQVKTNTQNNAQCATVFPYFTVNYTKSGDTKTVYYWLQDMINDGDTVTNGKFVKNMNGEEIPSGSTLNGYTYTLYKQLQEEIKEYVKNDNTLAQIKTKFPHWCFKNPLVNYIDDEGYTYVPSSVTGFTPLTDDELKGLMVDAINDLTTNYANSLLAIHKKQIKEDAKLVTEQNITQKN